MLAMLHFCFEQSKVSFLQKFTHGHKTTTTVFRVAEKNDIKDHGPSVFIVDSTPTEYCTTFRLSVSHSRDISTLFKYLMI